MAMCTRWMETPISKVNSEMHPLSPHILTISFLLWQAQFRIAVMSLKADLAKGIAVIDE